MLPYIGDYEPEKYSVTLSYGGDDNYNPSNETKKITAEEEVILNTVECMDDKNAIFVLAIVVMKKK